MPRRWWSRWSVASTCRRSRASCPGLLRTPTRSPSWPSGTTWTRRCAGSARCWAGRRTCSTERPPAGRSALRPGVGRRVGLGVADRDGQRDVLAVIGGAGALVGGAGLHLHVVRAGQVDRHALALLELLRDVPRGGGRVQLGRAEQDGQQDRGGDDDDAEHDQADDQAGLRLLRLAVRLLPVGLLAVLGLPVLRLLAVLPRLLPVRGLAVLRLAGLAVPGLLPVLRLGLPVLRLLPELAGLLRRLTVPALPRLLAVLARLLRLLAVLTRLLAVLPGLSLLAATLRWVGHRRS